MTPYERFARPADVDVSGTAFAEPRNRLVDRLAGPDEGSPRNRLINYLSGRQSPEQQRAVDPQTMAPNPPPADPFDMALNEIVQLMSAGGVTTGDIAARMPQRMPEREMRRQTREQMYAVEPSGPTPEQQNRLAAHRNWQTDVGEPAARNAIGELSGVNAMMRGGNRMSEGYSDGSPVQMAAGAGEAALGALPIARMTRAGASIVNALMGTLPRAVGTTTALAAPMAISDAQAQTRQGGTEAEAVRELQSRLKASGHYAGAIDGVLGPATYAAQHANSAAELARQGQNNEGLKAQADAARAGADAARSAADREETDRLRLSGEAEQSRKAGADARVREVEGNVPVVNRLLRDYGPVVGVVGGLVAGSLLRSKMVRASDAASVRVAERADGLITGKGSTPSRVGATNEYWGAGGAANLPFRASPRSASGFTPGSSVPPAANLYPPNRLSNGMADAGVLASGGVEMGLSYAHRERASAELAKAQEAMASDPSEVNIQRVQTALDNVAIGEAGWRGGAAFDAAYAVGMMKKQRTHLRPNSGAAEAERARLNRLIAKR